MRKFMFGLTINFFISLMLSVVISVAMPIVQGQPISLQILKMGTLYGTIVGTVFATLFNVGGISEAFARAVGAQRGTAGWLLTRNISIITIMLFSMLFFITGLLTGFGEFMGVSFVDRWIGPMPKLWFIGYIASVLLDPVCVWLAIKLVGAPGPAPAAMPAEG